MGPGNQDFKKAHRVILLWLEFEKTALSAFVIGSRYLGGYP